MKKDISQLSQEQVCALLKTSLETGLPEAQVEQLLKKDGPNEVMAPQASLLRIFSEQYANFLMLLLMTGVLFSFFLRQWIDGLMILSVLFINGILGTVQEYRAAKLARALKKSIPQQIRVRRDGTEKVIDRRQLVRGDIVLLENGGIVPADLRLARNFGVVLDESILTGESVGIGKSLDILIEAPKNPRDKSNMLFAGTVVIQGGCEAIVTATGEHTEFGHIINLVKSAKKRSSFLEQVNSLSSILFKTTLVLSALLFIALLLFKQELGINEIFLFAIALAIAIVPEMLPLISTIALTRASLHLAKSGVLVKRLTALEDLGGVEVICTDKTGTLTENRLKIKNIISDNETDCLYAALLASREMKDPDFVLAGSFDSAIWSYADAKLHQKAKEQQCLWAGSFDPYYRWQFSVYGEGAQARLVIKGAPESIVERSSLNEKARQASLASATKLGQQGYRVLAVASAAVAIKSDYEALDPGKLDYQGLLIFEDPIKSTAAEALAKAHELGLDIKILTGDSAEVAAAIGLKLGIVNNEKAVMTGEELNQIPPELFPGRIQEVKIFARVNPDDKYAIVRALAKTKSVMFLGEGINDAPALKTAGVGMVVQEASDIAKESADIILTRADLSVIVTAIAHGRQIMHNISKYILITLTGNFGSLYAIALIATITPILPLLPVQVLIENLFTDAPMISIVNSSISPFESRRPFSQNVTRIAFRAMMFGIAILLPQFIFYRLFSALPTDLFRTLWLVEIVLMEFMLILTLRTEGWFWTATELDAKSQLLFLSVIALTIAMPFVPPINGWLHLTPYSLVYLVPIVGLVLVSMGLIEALKRFVRTHAPI